MTKPTHPWLNDRCRTLIDNKVRADGTSAYEEKQRLCSEGLLCEYNAYIQRIRQRLMGLHSSPEKCWKLSGAIMFKSGQVSAIPLCSLYLVCGALMLKAKPRLLLIVSQPNM